MAAAPSAGIGSGNSISTSDQLTSGANDSGTRISYSGMNFGAGRTIPPFSFDNGSRAAPGLDYVQLAVMVAIAAAVYFLAKGRR